MGTTLLCVQQGIVHHIPHHHAGLGTGVAGGVTSVYPTPKETAAAFASAQDPEDALVGLPIVDSKVGNRKVTKLMSSKVHNCFFAG